MAQEWWSYNGPIKLLHSMNPLRVSYIQKQLTKHHSISTNYNISHDNNNDYLPFKGLRILDVGCGGGLLSESLVRLGASVLGVDASSENIKIAKLHSLKDPKLFSGPGNLEYQCITAGIMFSRFSSQTAKKTIKQWVKVTPKRTRNITGTSTTSKSVRIYTMKTLFFEV
ncbi:4792_t:CDS:2 [Entrophospora sp. SA101]|nr:4792_t:CDS:2 [Entrophospora sp. SA101]